MKLRAKITGKLHDCRIMLIGGSAVVESLDDNGRWRREIDSPLWSEIVHDTDENTPEPHDGDFLKSWAYP